MNSHDEIDQHLSRVLGASRLPDEGRLTSRIDALLAAERARESRWRLRWPVAWLGGAVVAAVIALALIQPAAPPTPPAAPPTGMLTIPDPSQPVDPLLPRTDVQTILLPSLRHLVVNDPTLQPHSIWQQSPTTPHEGG